MVCFLCFSCLFRKYFPFIDCLVYLEMAMSKWLLKILSNQNMKILKLGASGSGTTTLGIEIERRTDFKRLDVDDYYWKKQILLFKKKFL